MGKQSSVVALLVLIGCAAQPILDHQIVRVVDGDTVVTNAGNFRLMGHDTPELRGKCPEERAKAQNAKRTEVVLDFRPDSSLV